VHDDPVKTNRRRFLATSALAGACFLGPDSARSRVVLATDTGIRTATRRLDAARLLDLLDRALQSLFQAQTPIQAWKKVARPGETIGLKVNCLAGKWLSTSVALVEAVADRLQTVGVRAGNIIVWDRDSEDLESAGFRIAEGLSKVRCLGNDQTGFEEELVAFGSAGSLVSKTLTRLCDGVINLPVLKDHGIAGVSVALKNLFGAVHNPNKYHSNVGDPYIADVYMLPPIRGKVRLHICDATTAQYEGGPPFMPQWAWSCNSLLAATDPVALDYVAWQLIEKKRAENRIKSLAQVGRNPSYILTAADASHRIGIADPARIDVVRLTG